MSVDGHLNLQTGTVINGRYEVVKCLGTGSMGMVYACRHRELSGLLVAMKVLFAEVARDDVAAQRFRNEIVASYGVSNPNVVRAYEYFKDGDLVAFTMEYIGGGDLADRLNQDVLIPIEETIRLLRQMCSGVQAIHDAGIIHRDLKPENILLTEEGDIKITDFGIARTGSGPKLTEHGGVVGTIDYVSPEYLERGQVDARSDIYAMGVLAYEMITGMPPFKGKSVIETMTLRLKADPEPPHLLRSECSKALSAIVLKAMKRDPKTRYQAASEILQDLEKLGHDEGSIDVQGILDSSVDGSGEKTDRTTTETMSVSANSEASDSTSYDYDSSVLSEEDTEDIAAEIVSSVRKEIGDSMSANLDSSAFSEAAKAGVSKRGDTWIESALARAQDPRSKEYVDEDLYDSNALASISLGSSQLRRWDTPGREEYNRGRVSISDSHLSNQRVQELVDLYQTDSMLIFSIVKWIVVFLVVLGLCLLAVAYYYPELYEIKSLREAQDYLNFEWSLIYLQQFWTPAIK